MKNYLDVQNVKRCSDDHLRRAKKGTVVSNVQYIERYFHKNQICLDTKKQKH